MMRFRLLFKRLFFPIIIFVLFVAGSFAYFEINKDKLLSDFKVFIQSELSKSTGRKVTFGNLEGGVFSGITVNKFTVAQEGKDSRPSPLFEAEQLILNYRYWDIILGRFERLRYIRIYNGSIRLGKGPALVSEINGQIQVGQEAIRCSLLKGNALGAEVNLKGVIAELNRIDKQVDLTLNLDGNWANGFCRIQDSLPELSVIGAFNLKGNKKLDFTGRLLTDAQGLNFKNFLINNLYLLNAGINFSKKEGYLILEDENRDDILETVFSLYSDYSFLNQTKLNHIKLFGHDLRTSIVVMGNSLESEPGVLSGYIATSGTIIDYNPVGELEMVFNTSGDTFTIGSLKLGDSYQLSGNIGLSRPYPLDLNLKVTQARVSDLSILVKNKNGGTFSGQFDGQLKLSGSLPNNLEVNGHLEAGEGNIGTFKYEAANINFKGTGSAIYFEGSRIFRPGEGKYLTLGGFIDLAKLGRGSLLQDLKVSSDEKTIIWSGWDITKKPADTKLSFQKDVGEEFKVGFSTFINDETASDIKKGKDAVEIQYNLSQKQSLKLKLRENEEILGIEQRIEF